MPDFLNSTGKNFFDHDPSTSKDVGEFASLPFSIDPMSSSGFDLASTDLRVEHISHLAVEIYTAKIKAGLVEQTTLAGCIEAAWSAYQQIEKMVNDSDAKLLAKLTEDQDSNDNK